MRLWKSLVFASCAALALAAACATPSEGVPSCSPANCAGCCSERGVCEPGIAEGACGAAGAACSVCASAEQCTSGACGPRSGTTGGEVGEATGTEGTSGGTTTDGGAMTDGGTSSSGGVSDAGPDASAGCAEPLDCPLDAWCSAATKTCVACLPPVETLTFTSSTVMLRSTTVGQPNQVGAACTAAAAAAPERSYAVTVPPGSAQPLTVVVTPDDGLAYVPTVSITSSCPNDATLACSTGNLGSLGLLSLARPVGVSTGDLAPGTYTAIVDGAVTSGSYRLDARLGKPTNETCGTARPIELSTAQVDNSIVESTMLASNDVTSLGAGCIASDAKVGGGDLVFSFTAPTARDYTLWIAPSLGYDVSVVRLTGTCDASKCAQVIDEETTGKLEVKTFPMAAGETTWFVVDGFSAAPNAATGRGYFRMMVR